MVPDASSNTDSCMDVLYDEVLCLRPPPLVVSLTYDTHRSRIRSSTGQSLMQPTRVPSSKIIVKFCTCSKGSCVYMSIYVVRCFPFLPRLFVSCYTLPGAGKSLQWEVTVDSQVSELSSTDYAPPEIANLTGPGAIDASVYGNQVVTISGNYFGPSASLYGKA